MDPKWGYTRRGPTDPTGATDPLNSSARGALPAGRKHPARPFPSANRNPLQLIGRRAVGRAQAPTHDFSAPLTGILCATHRPEGCRLGASTRARPIPPLTGILWSTHRPGRHRRLGASTPHDLSIPANRKGRAGPRGGHAGPRDERAGQAGRWGARGRGANACAGPAGRQGCVGPRGGRGAAGHDDQGAPTTDSTWHTPAGGTAATMDGHMRAVTSAACSDRQSWEAGRTETPESGPNKTHRAPLLGPQCVR